MELFHYLAETFKFNEMKEYSVSIQLIPLIRAMFYGYIFRRTEDGIGYIKCTDKQRAIIESNGIKLNEL